MTIQWPEVIPEGLVYDAPVSTLDLVPTLVAAAGGVTDANALDGTDLRPFLTDSTSDKRPHDVLHWKRGDEWAVRKGDWKLVHDGSLGVQLFNIAQDESEQTDVSADHIELVAEMIELHRAWAAELAPPRWQRPWKSKR